MNNLLVLIGLFLCCHASAQSSAATMEEGSKINGINLVSMDRVLDSSEVIPMKRLNANWASVIPYAFVPGLNKPGLVFDGKWQWIGERSAGVESAIRCLHKQGVSVMVKPQLWIGHGEFSGHLEMPDENSWKQFEEEYLGYVLAFAQLAEREGAELFCLGTEMEAFVRARPAFWSKMIAEVRKVFSGKLTYAANWDGYADVPFWSELDFIGIDAYFPIADGRHPKKRYLIAGWRDLMPQLKKVSDQSGRRVLFTEYGYRSTPNCAESPWDYSEATTCSEKAQVNALVALYEVIWDQPFMAGGFLWKWYPDHENAGGPKNALYTVQNKKAEELVRVVYGR